METMFEIHLNLMVAGSRFTPLFPTYAFSFSWWGYLKKEHHSTPSVPNKLPSPVRTTGARDGALEDQRQVMEY